MKINGISWKKLKQSIWKWDKNIWKWRKKITNVERKKNPVEQNDEKNVKRTSVIRARMAILFDIIYSDNYHCPSKNMKIKKTTVLPQTCWELPVVRPKVGGGCRGGDGGKNGHKSERKRWKWKFMCKHTHFESVKWMNASKQANREMRIRFSRNLQLGSYARQEKNTLAEIT